MYVGTVMNVHKFVLFVKNISSTECVISVKLTANNSDTLQFRVTYSETQPNSRANFILSKPK
jgi:hypothetical protein